MRIISIAGTRAEAIRLAPLVRTLERQPAIEHRLIATGQEGALFHAALGWFGLAADADLALPRYGAETFADALGAALPALLREFAADLVLVHGASSGAWAAALTAAAPAIPVAHGEAGLRSRAAGAPCAEERRRIEIDGVASLLFAPSTTAAGNLVALKGQAHVTGSTGIDALLETRDRLPLAFNEGARKLIVATCRRPEAAAHLAGVAAALRRLADRPDVVVMVPLDADPAITTPLRALLAGHASIALEPSVAYPEMVGLMGVAHLLVTDGGGLQEEAPALGLPALILRERTDRPEPVASGNSRLVGYDPDRIVAVATRLLDDPQAHAAAARPSFPYGRGDAGARISGAIFEWLDLPAPFLFEPRLTRGDR